MNNIGQNNMEQNDIKIKFFDFNFINYRNAKMVLIADEIENSNIAVKFVLIFISKNREFPALSGTSCRDF
jgi:hypothetical protein